MITRVSEKIAIMQAYEDGKQIEHRRIGEGGTWRRAGRPAWNWEEGDYRVSDKVSVWAWVDIITGTVKRTFLSKSDALKWPNDNQVLVECTSRMEGDK